MLSHGMVSGALFLCVGVVYDRMHTREIAAYGGLVNRMPAYAACFMVFTLANVGLPGTSGFVGEFLTLLGAFRYNTWIAIFGTTGVDPVGGLCPVALSPRDLRAAGQGQPADDRGSDPREVAILVPLVVVTIFFGVYPKPVFDVTAPRPRNSIQLHQQGVRWRPTGAESPAMNLLMEADLRIAARADPGVRRHGAADARRVRRRKAPAGADLLSCGAACSWSAAWSS